MRSFFVAATGQNVGKTTACLGLLAGLKKRHKSVGFFKPVGQEHVETETGVHVDKDVVLFKSHFKLRDPYEEMSPVLFPRLHPRLFRWKSGPSRPRRQNQPGIPIAHLQQLDHGD